MALEVLTQLPRGDEEREEELLLHGITLVSITQHSTDKVYRMLDEGRWRCGSIGSLRRLVGGIVEAYL